MTSIQFFVLALILYLVGALVSLFVSGRTSREVAAFFSLLASVSGVISVILSLTEGAIPTLTLFAIQPFGEFALQMDLLSTLMVGIICLVGIATSLYSFTDAPANVSVSFFTDLFMASMLVVVTITNAFFFLVFWELMTLASYFLVVWEFDKKESAKTGFIYFLVAHVGAALIMVAFFLFFGKAGTFDFAGIRAAGLSPVVKDIAFLLAFLGFGAKAGMVPLHFWTPDTYAGRAQSRLRADGLGDEKDRGLRHSALLRGLAGRVGGVVGIYRSGFRRALGSLWRVLRAARKKISNDCWHSPALKTSALF